LTFSGYYLRVFLLILLSVVGTIYFGLFLDIEVGIQFSLVVFCNILLEGYGYPAAVEFFDGILCISTEN
jgi:hypothetical protein